MEVGFLPPSPSDNTQFSAHFGEDQPVSDRRKQDNRLAFSQGRRVFQKKLTGTPVGAGSSPLAPGLSIEKRPA